MPPGSSTGSSAGRRGRRAREPLSPQRIIAAAVEVADAQGLHAVSMRKVAQQLGVEAMSLYHHVPNKEAVLDGIVEAVYAEIELPHADDDWHEGMRRRAVSARSVLRAHSWAIALLDSRSNPGPATLTHHDAVIGCLLRGGFAVDVVASAFATIDAYVFGFVIQETSLPFAPDEVQDAVDETVAGMPDPTEYPSLMQMMAHAMSHGYAFADEFDRGLEMILDALARQR